MTSRHPSLCNSCNHFDLRSTTYEDRSGRCTAFPDGIPALIANGGDHRQPWPGDNEVQYELRPGDEDLFESWVVLVPNPAQPPEA